MRSSGESGGFVEAEEELGVFASIAATRDSTRSGQGCEARCRKRRTQQDAGKTQATRGQHAGNRVQRAQRAQVDREGGDSGNGSPGEVGNRGERSMALAAALLPGALLGAQIAGLLFFLNPELPFTPMPVLRSLVIYGGLVGLAGLTMQLPWVWRQPHRVLRALPWSLTVALALAAFLDWAHASIYTYYLLPGLNVRLIKTASWLSIATLIAFYTALLHTLHRRPYGRRSRLGFVALVAFSLYIMVERREAFQPPPPPSPLSSTAELRERHTLWVVGLEGATLEAVLPLAEQGHLPFFSVMLKEGAHGRLASFAPNQELALWTTLATGRYPYHHRVFGQGIYRADHLLPGARLRLLPLGVGFRTWGLIQPLPEEGGGIQAGTESLRLWEILPRMGLATGVVGWPGGSQQVGASSPTFALGKSFFESRPPGGGQVAQEEVADRGRLFRIRPEDIDPAVLAPFGRQAPSVVRRALAQDLWRETLCLFLLDQHRELGATFLHLPGLGSVSRDLFGGYTKMQFEGAQHRDYLRAGEAVTRYYGHLDGFLADLWSRRPDRTFLVVVSAYGTSAPRGVQRIVTELAGGRPLEGHVEDSPDGIALLLGPGIEGGALLSGAELVDIVPTLAYGLGLPIARDLDGRILTEAFERSFLARHPLAFVPSYETLQDRPDSADRPAP